MRDIVLKVIEKLMGYTTIEMTMRCSHLSYKAQESAVQDRPIPKRASLWARGARGAH